MTECSWTLAHDLEHRVGVGLQLGQLLVAHMPEGFLLGLADRGVQFDFLRALVAGAVQDVLCRPERERGVL